MLVSELIKILQGFDPTLAVLVDGYEGGAKEPARVAVRDFVAEKNDGSGYCGPHEEISDGEFGQYDREDALAEGKAIFKAVIISRT